MGPEIDAVKCISFLSHWCQVDMTSYSRFIPRPQCKRLPQGRTRRHLSFPLLNRLPQVQTFATHDAWLMIRKSIDASNSTSENTTTTEKPSFDIRAPSIIGRILDLWQNVTVSVILYHDKGRSELIGWVCWVMSPSDDHCHACRWFFIPVQSPKLSTHFSGRECPWDLYHQKSVRRDRTSGFPGDSRGERRRRSRMGQGGTNSKAGTAWGPAQSPPHLPWESCKCAGSMLFQLYPVWTISLNVNRSLQSLIHRDFCYLVDSWVLRYYQNWSWI